MNLPISDFKTIQSLEDYVETHLAGAYITVDPKSGAVTIHTNMCVDVAGNLI